MQNASRNFKSPFITAFSKFSHDDVSYRILRNLKCSMTTQYLLALKNKYDLAVTGNQFAGTDKRLKNFGIYDDFKFVSPQAM